jgi:hypothetical protein
MNNPFSYYFIGDASGPMFDRKPFSVDPLKKYDSLGTRYCDRQIVVITGLREV